MEGTLLIKKDFRFLNRHSTLGGAAPSLCLAGQSGRVLRRRAASDRASTLPDPSPRRRSPEQLLRTLSGRCLRGAQETVKSLTPAWRDASSGPAGPSASQHRERPATVIPALRRELPGVKDSLTKRVRAAFKTLLVR